jgi:hypothetical protein
MIQLCAQFPFVDLVGQAHRLRPVDQREGGVDIRVHAPDHLQHQELVEIRVEQAADDRVKLPGMIVDAARNVCPGHAEPLQKSSGTRNAFDAYSIEKSLLRSG